MYLRNLLAVQGACRRLDSGLSIPYGSALGDAVPRTILGKRLIPTASVTINGQACTFTATPSSITITAVPALSAGNYDVRVDVGGRIFTIANGYTSLPMAGWYIASRGVTGATAVTAWADQSGNNRHLATSAGKEPALVASEPRLGGAPTIDFNGSKWMNVSWGSTIAQPIVDVAVCYYTQTGVGLIVDGYASSPRCALFFDTTTIKLFASSVSSGFTTYTNNGVVFHGSFNGASSVLGCGDRVLTVNPGSYGMTGITLGTDSGKANPMNGAYAEVIILAGATSLPQAVRENLHARYALNNQGTLTTKWGCPSGTIASGFTNDVGTAARFYYPYGLALDDARGYLYVADAYNHAVRRIDLATNAVTTVAGTGSVGSRDDTGTSASFNNPCGLCISSDGNTLYVLDSSNYTIRKIVLATGVVTTWVGTAGQLEQRDGTGTGARLSGWPWHAVIRDGYMYVACWAGGGSGGGGTIRKINLDTAEVTTFAGAYAQAGTTDGYRTDARFSAIVNSLCFNADGTYLLVQDRGNNILRSIDWATGQVTTISGVAGTATWADGVGSAIRWNGFAGIVCVGPDDFVITDSSNRLIRRMRKLGGQWVASTIAGDGSSAHADGTGKEGKANHPIGIVRRANGKFYIAQNGSHCVDELSYAT